MERKESALKVLVHNQWDPAMFVLEESLQKLYLDSITYCCTYCSDENIVTCLLIVGLFNIPDEVYPQGPTQSVWSCT